MMTTQTCKGFVTLESGEIRPCKNSGDKIRDNGYCSSHQNQAASEIIHNLTMMKQELEALKRVKHETVDLNKIEVIQNQIESTQINLSQLGIVCASNPECQSQLKEISVGVNELISPDGEPNKLPKAVIRDHNGNFQQIKPLSRMEELNNNIDTLSLASHGDDSLVIELSKQYELARRQESTNNTKIIQLESELTNASSNAQQQEMQFQDSLSNLSGELKEASNWKQKASIVTESLNEQLSNCRAKSLEISGEYSQAITQVKEEVEQYKSMYNNSMGRQITLNKSIEQLSTSEDKLKGELLNLKDSYQEKIKVLQEDYADKVKHGGLVLSEREQELNGQVHQLKTDLETSLNELKLSNDSGKEALEHVRTTQRPYSDLARELLTTNSQLQNASKNVMKLQEDRDKLREMLGRHELNCANNVDRLTAENRTEIQKLSRNLELKERELAARQKQLSDLQNQLSSLRSSSQNKVNQLEIKLTQTTFQLAQYRETMQQQNQTLENKQRMTADALRSQKMNNDFKYKQLEDDLRHKFNAKTNELQDKYNSNQDIQNQQKRELLSVQERSKQVQKSLETQRLNLDKYREMYEAKMANFDKQKDQLNSSLLQSQQQAEQFSQLEKDHKRRVDILRQALQVDRHRYQSEIQQLKSNLREAIQAKNSIVNSLEKCGAARDSIIERANLLTNENTRIKDQFLQLKSKHDLIQSQFNTRVEQIQNQANKLKSSVAVCASKLDDASMAHDDVVRMTEENRALRLDMERKIKAATSSENALRKLLKDHELAKQRLIQLEGALQSCSGSKNMLNVNLQNTNSQLRDLKRMESSLSTELENSATEYQQALLNRDSQLVREKLRMKSKEESLKQKFSDVQLSKQELQQRIETLQRQQSITQNTLVDTVVNNAEQIQGLVQAEQYSTPSGQPVATGRSSLLSQ